MPQIDLKAHIQPSEGSVQWWKSLNRSIQQADLRIKEFSSPALTVKIVCGEESFSCWRFLISNPLLSELLTQPSCCTQEEKMIILDSQFELLPFMLLKQYLTSGKLMVSSNKVTSESITQVQDMMAWVCPGIDISGGGAKAPELKVSGIETKDLNFSVEEKHDQVNVEIVEDVGENLNNNLSLIKDMDTISNIKTKTPKKLMKCHICGFSKKYIPQHEWRFREHVKMCNTKVDEDSVVEVEQDEKDQVVINCMLCEKTFRNPSTLKMHMVLVHYRREIRAVFVTPTGEDQNLVKKCKECTYKSKALSCLIGHYGLTHRRLYDVAPKEVLELVPAEKQKKRRSKYTSLMPGDCSVSSEGGIFKEEADYDEEMED